MSFGNGSAGKRKIYRKCEWSNSHALYPQIYSQSHAVIEKVVEVLGSNGTPENVRIT